MVFARAGIVGTLRRNLLGKAGRRRNPRVFAGASPCHRMFCDWGDFQASEELRHRRRACKAVLLALPPSSPESPPCELCSRFPPSRCSGARGQCASQGFFSARKVRKRPQITMRFPSDYQCQSNAQFSRLRNALPKRLIDPLWSDGRLSVPRFD